MVPIDIPAELLPQIDNIARDRVAGYRSREDFVQDAVRRRLDELKKAPLDRKIQ